MTTRVEVIGSRAGRGWLRALSLAAAGLVSLALMLDPFLLSGVPSARLHDALPLMMIGIAGLFVYGLGFGPRAKALRMVFHPATAWTVFLIGAAALAGAG